MSTPKQLSDELVSIFQNSSDLSDVNDNAIMKGDRAIEDHSFPSILVEPVRNEEEIADFGTDDVELRAYIAIIGRIKEHAGHSEQIDALLDLENNIKKAIYSDPELNSKADYTYIVNTTYNRDAGHPVAELIMEIVVHYQQDKSART